METGRRIAEARRQRGLTQEQLSEAIGCSRVTLNRWERGKMPPSTDYLVVVAQVLGVSVDYLMGSDSTQPVMPPEARELTDLIPVPILSEERTACLGAGAIDSDLYNDSDSYISVEHSALRAYDDLRRPYAIKCHGECLESAGLFDGYLAIINPAEEPSNGNLALLSINGLLSIKFISRRPNGNLAISCDTGTETFTRDQLAEMEFAILGAVVSFQPSRRPTKFF